VRGAWADGAWPVVEACARLNGAFIAIPRDSSAAGTKLKIFA
jgi:hypothetical protein